MNNKIPCDVILDLLPLCAEGLSSDKSSDAVQQHIKSCPSCQRAAENITKSPADESAPCDERDNERSVDYLKKIRSRSRKKIITAVCITFCLALLTAGFKLFVYGSPDYDYTVKISSEVPAGSDADYTIKGNFIGSAAVFGHYKVRATADGGEELIVYSCLSSPLNRTGSFSIDCSVNAKYLDINGTRIMADGTIYDAGLAKRLFDAAHPYIGDMPANNELAFVLDIAGLAGQYYNRLHTEAEPYGWEFVFSETQNLNKQDEINEYMKKNAVILLALVGNCDEIMWSFAADVDDAPDEPAYKVTSAEASSLLGTDVKSLGKSPEQIMMLLKALNL